MNQFVRNVRLSDTFLGPTKKCMRFINGCTCARLLCLSLSLCMSEAFLKDACADDHSSSGGSGANSQSASVSSGQQQQWTAVFAKNNTTLELLPRSRNVLLFLEQHE